MDFKTVVTTCPICAVGCGLSLSVLDGKIVSTLPSKTSPTNKGKLCIKGWNIYEFVQHPDRLTTPLIKENGSFRKADWNDAYEYAGKELRRIRDKYGPDSIGFLSSARCTNEENYIFQKFVRTAIGTNNVDHCARL